MTPAQAKRLAEFNRRFRIVPTSLLGRAKDLSAMNPGPLTGDCQTYCRTVRNILGLNAARIFNLEVKRRRPKASEVLAARPGAA